MGISMQDGRFSLDGVAIGGIGEICEMLWQGGSASGALVLDTKLDRPPRLP
jgi:hypothetical protein